VTDANDHTESTTYNQVGLPILVQDALGYTTTLHYDEAYNMVEMVNALGHATTYDYDPLGRLRALTDPLGNATTYTRDALGRVTQTTDANGHTTAYDYDALGQLITVTDALSGTTAYVYDAAGNLTVITDANQNVTRFEYNFLNQLKREINPLDHTWEYWYDAAGRLTGRRDALWRATYYDYDSNGRLVEISYGVTPETMHPVTFTYDLEGNETQMCDALGCTTHVYDKLGLPTSTTDWLGRAITRTYDAVGNFTGLTYPNGYQTQYQYNANDWLTTFIDPHAEASVYTRNLLGQVTEIRHPNDTIASFDYDAAGRLTGITNRQDGAAQPQSAYQYALDKVGNRTQVIETRAAFDGNGSTVSLVHTYGYDALDRLISAATDAPASATGYSFDPVGNRLAKTGTVLVPDAGTPELPVAPEPEASAYTYNAANQLMGISDERSETSLAYNANGDRVQETEVLTDGTTLITDYCYDREDRLVGVTKTVSDSAALTVTMVATYTYDGYGRRAIKEVVEYEALMLGTLVVVTPHVSSFTYLYDGLDIIGAQLEQDGVVTETYYYLAPSPITGLRRPFEMERLPNAATGFAGDRHWYQSDGLDSVVALTDEGGDLASPFLYDEYGRVLAGTTELQVFAYTAQDYDVETGLVHFYARYYDAKFGIWITQDKYHGQLSLPSTLHRYSYVLVNPTSKYDLYGYLFTEAEKSEFFSSTDDVTEFWVEVDETSGQVKLGGPTVPKIEYTTHGFGWLSLSIPVIKYEPPSYYIVVDGRVKSGLVQELSTRRKWQATLGVYVDPGTTVSAKIYSDLDLIADLEDTRSTRCNYNYASSEDLKETLKWAMRAEGVPESWFDDLYWIMMAETDGRVGVRNYAWPTSTARGLFQLKDYHWELMPYGEDSFGIALHEMKGGIRYIVDRYGTAENARATWEALGWY
jgi:RHS repeat-associated protein